ncbi:hypothetical protein F511_02199 [Dorcoceras hygrometricum]|uniref:Uncharacterized protein n=1 Tax=Dorcoceras hygrometricum TaxID=472368 RepID=A0A2Z7APG5_9LAMI|nr:hypothetical protein F511_02199 [Dorcoceras hygrometricum]
MEISVISDAISTVVYSTQGFAFSNFLLNRPYNVLSLTDTPSDQPLQTPSPSPPSSSAVHFRISAAAPPATRTLTKPRLRRIRRVKQKSLISDHDGSEGDGFFGFIDGCDFSGGDGHLGSSGGGRGWNFGGYGGANWEESSNDSISDPAFDFVYEVLCWIAMSNCLHFAFKKVVRIVADGFGDPAREKVVRMPLTPVC